MLYITIRFVSKFGHACRITKTKSIIIPYSNDRLAHSINTRYYAKLAHDDELSSETLFIKTSTLLNIAI